MKQQDVPVFKRVAAALHRQSERHKRAIRHLEETADAAMVGWAKAAAEVEKLTAERDEARATAAERLSRIGELAADRQEAWAALQRARDVCDRIERKHPGSTVHIGPVRAALDGSGT